jgi:hypothetical protein
MLHSFLRKYRPTACIPAAAVGWYLALEAQAPELW